MLAPALAHKDELQKRHVAAAIDPSFAYVHTGGYGYLEVKLESDTWHKMQLVSVDKKGSVIGYISMNIARPQNHISNLAIYCYTDNSAQRAVVAGDLKLAIEKAFLVFNINKMTWSVLVGNPIERMYDRLCTMMGGRVVGTFKQEDVTSTGVLCDTKWYEVLRKDFLKAISKKTGDKYIKEIRFHTMKGGS